MGNVNEFIDINPDICFGKARIEDTGITTESILKRFMNGESIPRLINDYDFRNGAIRAAIYYEYSRLIGLDGLNIKLAKALKKSIRAYEFAINAIPSGTIRNELTEERILAEDLLNKLSGIRND